MSFRPLIKNRPSEWDGTKCVWSRSLYLFLVCLVSSSSKFLVDTRIDEIGLWINKHGARSTPHKSADYEYFHCFDCVVLREIWLCQHFVVALGHTFPFTNDNAFEIFMNRRRHFGSNLRFYLLCMRPSERIVPSNIFRATTLAHSPPSGGKRRNFVACVDFRDKAPLSAKAKQIVEKLRDFCESFPRFIGMLEAFRLVRHTISDEYFVPFFKFMLRLENTEP